MQEQSPQPILAGYRYALRLKPAQETQLRRHAGCCRFVWNEALAHIKNEMASGNRAPRYVTLANRLPELKAQHAFLKEAPSQALQQTLKDLDQAIGAAFSKTDPRRFPKFKKRGERDSVRFPQGFAYDADNGRIIVPKLGALRLRHSRVAPAPQTPCLPAKECGTEAKPFKELVSRASEGGKAPPEDWRYAPGLPAQIHHKYCQYLWRGGFGRSSREEHDGECEGHVRGAWP